MRVTIAAIGRLKIGPERELFERFIGRAHDSGRRLGLAFDQREYPESRAGSGDLRKAQEADQLAGAIAGGAAVIALDERGVALDSRGFADRIARWRDGGKEQIVFVLGGADGLSPALTERTDLRLAFGKLTWPHQLARVMLAEQLYRAVTILSGHPYHRD